MAKRKGLTGPQNAALQAIKARGGILIRDVDGVTVPPVGGRTLRTLVSEGSLIPQCDALLPDFAPQSYRLREK